MQTKTLSNLVLEFPALEKSKGKALKGGSCLMFDWKDYASGGSGYVVMNQSQYQYNQSHWVPLGITPYDPSWWAGTSSGNSNGGNYGGGGGGSVVVGTNNNNDPIYFNSQSIHGNLPPNNGSDTQVGGLCVFKSMEIVDHFFGGNSNSGSFGLQYSQIYNDPNFVNGGFNQPLTELYNYLEVHFNINVINTASAAVNALNNNHPVLATRLNGDGTGHEVVITGHDEIMVGNMLTVNYHYFDSQTGFYNIADDSTFYNLIEITGKK